MPLVRTGSYNCTVILSCCASFALCSPMAARISAAQDATQTLAGQSQTSSATLSISAREVLLDVAVTDKSGAPVTGLTTADFSVTEDGGAQHLTHLEEHHSMSAEEIAKLKAAPVLPPNTFTNFAPIANTNSSTVILLDAMDMSVQTQMELREQLIDCLKTLQPGTPVAIFQMDLEMRLIQGFTVDPQVLWAAAKSKRDMPSMLKPIRGSRDEYYRARMEILRSGFQMMGRYLAGFPGRKSLIWMTGSIPQSYLNDPLGSAFGRSFKDDFSVIEDQPGDLMDALSLSRVAVYPIDARGLQTPMQFQASNGGGRSANADMRSESRKAFQHMDLDQIADQTGGKAIYNTNGLKQAIAEIINNGSSYYTLAYATSNNKWDGQFRHIKITVNKPGVQVQYRHGYYAIDRQKQEARMLAAMQKRNVRGSSNPFGEDDATDDNNIPQTAGASIAHPKGGFAETMQLGAIPPTEVIFTARLAIDDKVVKLDKNAPLPKDNYLAADWKGKPFRTYALQIVTDAHALRMDRSADGVHHGTVEFVTLVYDQQGRQVNSLTSTMTLNVSDARYLPLLQSGLPLKQEIAVPVKGNYFIRIGVHDIPSDHIGAVEIPVDEVRDGIDGQGLARQ